jgi:hypothetical protein
VAPATKAALRAAADRQQITETALLKRMLDLVLNSASTPAAGNVVEPDQPTRQARLYVRLTGGDRQLLQERAAGRHLAPATYASVLLRAHLRALTPLPEAELQALRQSTRELAAIGRQLNQIACASHQGPAGIGVGREELRALLKACEALRDHVRAYVSANVTSWESGDATSQP